MAALPSDAKAFHAVTSLIHDLANATGHYAAVPSQSRSGGSKTNPLAQLVSAVSTFFVRDSEFVTAAARLTAISADVVELNFVLCSQAVDSGGMNYQPLDKASLNLMDIIDAHSRNLTFREYGALIHRLLHDYLCSAANITRSMNIKVTLCACLLLNSAPAISKALDWGHSNIVLLMKILGQENLAFDALIDPVPAFSSDIKLLQMITGEVWSSFDGIWAFPELEDLSTRCAGANIAPDYHLWTRMHWQQFARCLYFLFLRVSQSIAAMNSLSAKIKDGKTPRLHLEGELGRRWTRMEGDLRILQVLKISSTFHNFICILRSSLEQDFSQAPNSYSPFPCSPVGANRNSRLAILLGEYGSPSPQSHVVFYRSWLKSLIAHLEACDIIDRYATYFAPRVFTIHDLKKMPEIKLSFSYLPLLPVGLEPVSRDTVLNSILQESSSSRQNDSSEIFVKNLLHTMPSCSASGFHELSVHAAIHLAIRISYVEQGFFSSDFYPEIGASSTCCIHCSTCLARMGFSFNTLFNSNSIFLDRESIPASPSQMTYAYTLLPPMALSPDTPSPICSALIQHLVNPLKLQLSNLVHKHRFSKRNNPDVIRINRLSEPAVGGGGVIGEMGPGPERGFGH